MDVTSAALQAVSMMMAKQANATSIITLKAAAAADQQVVQLIQAATGNGLGSLVDIAV